MGEYAAAGVRGVIIWPSAGPPLEAANRRPPMATAQTAAAATLIFVLNATIPSLRLYGAGSSRRRLGASTQRAPDYPGGQDLTRKARTHTSSTAIHVGARR